MPDKSVTNLPLAFLWRDYRAADQAATAAYELCCSLKIEQLRLHPDCRIDRAGALSAYREWRQEVRQFEIENSIAEANREWEAALERLNRIRDAFAITPISSHADAMIKARFLDDFIADTLGEPWDTVWRQLNDRLSSKASLHKPQRRKVSRTSRFRRSMTYETL